MAYIHQLAEWPHFTWSSKRLATALAEARHKQGLLIGKLSALGFDLRTEANVNTLTNDVVKSSAIEGEHLNRDEVRSSIARRFGLEVAGLTPPRRDVEGIVELILDATQNYEQRLTATRLYDWHAALFPTGRSGMRQIVVGAWRTGDDEPMQVVSGPYGRERVHFEAPDASRVASEMDAFLTWFNAPPEVDPVLKASVAHFWFVTIHPFEDGNGRIARAIADMALAQADNTHERFYSMSAQIEAERKEYYLRLETAQRGTLDITDWLVWFLNCFTRALQNAEELLAAVLLKAEIWKRINRRPVNERQRLVINRMLDGFQGFLTNSKYAKLAKCSSDTALRDIRELIQRGILIQNPGGGRSTSYRLANTEELA